RRTNTRASTRAPAAIRSSRQHNPATDGSIAILMMLSRSTRSQRAQKTPSSANRFSASADTIHQMSIRVVLVDDHPIVLQGLQHLFERQADFEVVSCCEDAATAIEAVRAQHPDVLVLDLRMPGANGLDVLRTMFNERIPCRTVLLTAAITEEQVLEAVKLGAAGLVLKESPPDTLVSCVRRVHQGEQWIDQDTVSRAFRAVLDR